MDRWHGSKFTGLFTRAAAPPLRAHDPRVEVFTAELPAWGSRREALAVGGAGWDEESAELACVGEAIERMQAYLLPSDRRVTARFEDWPLDEPAGDPKRWILFHPEQYDLPDFPFRPLDHGTACSWTCFRSAPDGAPCWVPEGLVSLFHDPQTGHPFAPVTSTGLACGRWGDPVLLRGLQEVIERDGITGAWMRGYRLEAWEPSKILASLEESVGERMVRTNLTYRCYRVVSPYSAHVTLVSVEGEDREGYCFSVGSACRETRAESWTKSLLEAIHGRFLVRQLKSRAQAEQKEEAWPGSFHAHALYYSLHSELLPKTALQDATATASDAESGKSERLADLFERLGPHRSVLFRNLTPPGIASEFRDWHVLQVAVPGLQPLHGNHFLPFLGGPLWAPRGWKEWKTFLPHPFA